MWLGRTVADLNRKLDPVNAVEHLAYSFDRVADDRESVHWACAVEAAQGALVVPDPGVAVQRDGADGRAGQGGYALQPGAHLCQSAKAHAGLHHQFAANPGALDKTLKISAARKGHGSASRDQFDHGLTGGRVIAADAALVWVACAYPGN
ncbi:hypothetical protein D3C78_528380 [compost metagenome]